MALKCYGSAPMGSRAFLSLLYDAGRSNSGPAGRAFPSISSGEDMVEERVGYVETRVPFLKMTVDRTARGHERATKSRCARRAQNSSNEG